MLKNYFYLIALGYLLLAGCGREPKKQETAGSAKPRVAADADRSSRPLPSVVPAATPGAAATGIASPKAAQEDVAVSNKAAPRIRRGATTLADVPDTAPEPASFTPDSAAAGELRRFLLAGLPAAQRFAVQPDRDTMLVGAQGTQLLIPAGIWELPTDSSGVVALELREFYQRADMVLAGLNTTSGPQLLETGGMLHLSATANGQPVQLRPGRYVHLRMPTAGRRQGMQLFAGKASGPDHRVDWQLPEGPAPAAGSVAPAVGQSRKKRAETERTASADSSKWRFPRPQPAWPEYKQLSQELVAQYRTLDNTRRRRRNRQSSQREKNALGQLSDDFNQRIVRRAIVNFTIDSTGTLLQPIVSANADPEVSALLKDALLKLGRWQPAKAPIVRNKRHIGFEHVAAVGGVELLFAKSGQLYVQNMQWSIAKTSRPHVISARRELDSLLADKGFRRRYQHERDSVIASRRIQEENRVRSELARLRTQFTDTSTAAITERGVYNELSSQGLSWINCDRFVSMSARINYEVLRPKETVVKLLFKDSRSIVTNDYLSRDKMASFHSAPLNQSVTIVALRREKGVTYLALHDTSISAKAFSELRFHPVTMAELRAELAKL